MNKSVRNICIASLISASIVASAVFATPAAAQSVGDIQKQIQELLAKVAALQEQLRIAMGNQGTSVPPSDTVGTVPRICTVLPPRGLALGARGEKVRGLQEFLRAEGYLAAGTSGYFGPQTRDALARWQASQGFQAAGVVGPLTLERIRARCGGMPNQQFTAMPARGPAPLAVTFSTWLSGFRAPSVTYAIDFGDGSQERAADCPAPTDACVSPGQNTHTYQKDGTYTATLNKITDPCGGLPAQAGNPACKAPIQSEVVAKVQIHVGNRACTMEYAPVCGQPKWYCPPGMMCATVMPSPKTYGNRCLMNADGAEYLYDGQCRSEGYACTADAMQCPNGTWVGRTGPNCQFVCPSN